MLHNPTALKVIDELFVENDCGHLLMAECGWNQFYPRTVDDALCEKELWQGNRLIPGSYSQEEYSI